MRRVPGDPSLPLRDRIFHRDEFRCVYCARVLPPEELSVDHVEPRMRGGDQSGGNLVTACRPCNTAKGSLPAWAFLAERPEERSNFLTLARHLWPRLRRAVVEAAERARERRSG